MKILIKENDFTIWYDNQYKLEYSKKVQYFSSFKSLLNQLKKYKLITDVSEYQSIINLSESLYKDLNDWLDELDLSK
jgi:hypothetical protein